MLERGQLVAENYGCSISRWRYSRNLHALGQKFGPKLSSKNPTNVDNSHVAIGIDQLTARVSLYKNINNISSGKNKPIKLWPATKLTTTTTVTTTRNKLLYFLMLLLIYLPLPWYFRILTQKTCDVPLNWGRKKNRKSILVNVPGQICCWLLAASCPGLHSLRHAHMCQICLRTHGRHQSPAVRLFQNLTWQIWMRWQQLLLLLVLLLLLWLLLKLLWLPVSIAYFCIYVYVVYANIFARPHKLWRFSTLCNTAVQHCLGHKIRPYIKGCGPQKWPNNRCLFCMSFASLSLCVCVLVETLQRMCMCPHANISISTTKYMFIQYIVYIRIWIL